jgi:hypothetical protein
MKLAEQVLHKLKNLSELFVLGDKRAKEGDGVIAYRQWVWVINDDNLEELQGDVIKKLKLKKQVFFDVDDFLREIAEDSPDVIVGRVYDGDLYLPSYGSFRHSLASKTLKKVLSALNLRGIVSDFPTESGDQSEYREDRYNMVKNLKNADFYHGTDYSTLDRISKLGLMANPSRSNFKHFNISHKDKVFITLNKEKAYFHAMTSARNNDSFPVILKMRIPDPDKLVMDYDVAIEIFGSDHKETIRLGYSEIGDKKANSYKTIANSNQIQNMLKRSKGKVGDLNTALGVFGYVGRIPAKFIEKVLIDEYQFEDFIRANEYGDVFSIENIETNLDRWQGYSFKELKQQEEDTLEELRGEYEDDW